MAIENSIRRGTAAAAWLSFWSAITREERSKRLAANTSPAAGFPRQLWRNGVSGVRAGTCRANTSPVAGFPCQLWRNGISGVHAGTDKRLILGREYGQDARAGKSTASFRQKTRDKKHTRTYAFYRVLMYGFYCHPWQIILHCLNVQRKTVCSLCGSEKCTSLCTFQREFLQSITAL